MEMTFANAALDLTYTFRGTLKAGLRLVGGFHSNEIDLIDAEE